ncbi:MAG: dTDP-4-dehydrorhamnose reductase [Candidatus Micrarchaeia archaeon]
MMLVVGGSGLLGSRVALLARENGFEMHATYFGNKPDFLPEEKMHRLDIREQEKTATLISKLEPEVVVHSAAMIGVDECEKEKEEAYAINVVGTQNVADACRKVDAKLIYVSTDYVFDGRKGNYVEEDEPNPINYYGKTKLEGERIVSKLDDYAIVRVSVLYGWPLRGQHDNFVSWAIKTMRNGGEVHALTDQRITPTFADNAAEAILTVVKKNANGIYHTTGSRCITRFEFANLIASVFNLEKRLIKPITFGRIGWVAERPKNNCLLTKKIEKELGFKMNTPEEGLIRMKNQEGGINR